MVLFVGVFGTGVSHTNIERGLVTSLFFLGKNNRHYTVKLY